MFRWKTSSFSFSYSDHVAWELDLSAVYCTVLTSIYCDSFILFWENIFSMYKLNYFQVFSIWLMKLKIVTG